MSCHGDSIINVVVSIIAAFTITVNIVTM